MVINIKDITILAIVLSIGIGIGILIEYSFLPRKTEYIPDPKVKYLKEVNIKLVDCVSFWQGKYYYTDSCYKVTEKQKQNIKSKYEKELAKIKSANATDGTAILGGFLAE